jgi:drug/metabolite transporter (DMT)-like permease
MSRPRRTSILLAFAVLTVVWGTTWAAIRIGLDGIPPFTGVALRFVIASTLLLAAIRWYRIRLGGSPHERFLWGVNALLTFVVSYGVIYWAEQWVPSSLGSVLFATFPLLVAVLAHFALPGERLGLRSAAGIVLGFGGVLVIFSEDLARLGGPQVFRASAVMLVSPVVSAVSSVAVKRWGKGIHPLSLTAVPMGIAAAVMAGLAGLFERHRPLHWSAATLAALVYLALVGSAVTFSLYYWLLAHVRATLVSLVAYLTPVVAVAVGILFLREPMTGRILAGSLLVLSGVALAVHSPSSA